ncbi:glycosyltransferase [Vibrio splendidus]|uniref:glycosyltransferase n=1 Tax=Vibrio splendidus TaxID=29497 RepID=UPI000C84E655|nr:glycosyltransferase [Vibrio splendidus]PMI53767.1 hypothetical protein BCU42_20240 [Vibrio splendidus]
MIKVAVLIPVFNNQKGLDLSLMSIVFDEYKYEVTAIVIDDGSHVKIRDNSVNSKLNVEITHLDRNLGIISALNCGLSKIYSESYDFYFRLDCDDLFVNRRFSKQMNYFEFNNDVDLLGSYAEFVDLKGKSKFVFKPDLKHSNIIKSMHYNSCFCHPAVAVRVNDKTRIFYSEQYKHAEDYEFYWRMLKTVKSHNFPEVLLETVADPNGISRSRRTEQLYCRVKIQLKYFKVKDINSYFGVVKTLLLILLPYKLVEVIKGAF